MSLPLEGLRILAVEQYGAGPYGSCHLADMGAEVIKIEHRASGGDMARGVGPYFLGEHDSEFYQTFNRNKKSLTLDIKHARGREVFEKLVASADALFGNMRGKQPVSRQAPGPAAARLLRSARPQAPRQDRARLGHDVDERTDWARPSRRGPRIAPPDRGPSAHRPGSRDNEGA